MRPDLAKFRQFGKIFKVLGNFLRVCFTICENLGLTRAKFVCHLASFH